MDFFYYLGLEKHTIKLSIRFNRTKTSFYIKSIMAKTFYFGKNIKSLLMITGLIFIFSCDTTLLEKRGDLLGFNFFPLEIGNYIDYNVVEITYPVVMSEPIITKTYELREQITEIFTDIDGQISFKLLRQSRPDASQLWKTDSVWFAKKNTFRAVKVENNIPYVKLSFPVKEGLEWDGNSMNGKDKELYRMFDIGKKYEMNQLSFPNTLKIEQQDLCTFVSLDRRYEVYADSIGVVYKEKWNLELNSEGNCRSEIENFCANVNAFASEDKPSRNCIVFGKIVIQKIKSYGKL